MHFNDNFIWCFSFLVHFCFFSLHLATISFHFDCNIFFICICLCGFAIKTIISLKWHTKAKTWFNYRFVYFTLTLSASCIIRNTLYYWIIYYYYRYGFQCFYFYFALIKRKNLMSLLVLKWTRLIDVCWFYTISSPKWIFFILLCCWTTCHSRLQKICFENDNLLLVMLTDESDYLFFFTNNKKADRCFTFQSNENRKIFSFLYRMNRKWRVRLSWS